MLDSNKMTPLRKEIAQKLHIADRSGESEAVLRICMDKSPAGDKSRRQEPEETVAQASKQLLEDGETGIVMIESPTKRLILASENKKEEKHMVVPRVVI